MASPETMAAVVLRCTDGRTSQVPRDCVLVSKFVERVLSSTADVKLVNLPEEVRAEELALIVKFIVEHKGREVPVLEKQIDPSIPSMDSVVKNKFDRELVEEAFGGGRLIKLMVAADSMGIESLKDACAARVALCAMTKAPGEKLSDLLKGSKAEKQTASASSSSSSSSSPSSSPRHPKRAKKG
jgi:hypothetical protein